MTDREFDKAQRLKQLPPYLFIEIDKAKRRLATLR